MSKKIIIAISIAMIIPCHVSLGSAEQDSSAPTKTEITQSKTTSELENIIATNDMFMETARAAAAQTGNPKAKSLFERAETFRRNGRAHFMAGEEQPSIDDYSESSHLAIQAIIIVKNEQGLKMREAAIEASDIIKAGDDRERNEALIKDGMSEAKTFIKTAKWLQQESASDNAALLIAQAETLYDKSAQEFSEGKYPNALEDINAAYTAATDAIKIIKSERPEIITFPRSKSPYEKDILASELRRNDAYGYFAAQLVSNKSTAKAANLLRKGNSLRDDASDSLDAKETKKAIELLRESTDSYIMAIKFAIK